MPGIHAARSTPVEERWMVGFELGGEEYGVDITNVREINRMLAVSRIANAPEYVEGIINLRGKVIPLVCLRQRFNMEKKGKDKHTRIVVIDIAGAMFGIVVDSVSEVLRLSVQAIEPPPPLIAGKRTECITGIGKIGDKIIILLDVDKLFADMKDELLNTAS